MLRRMFFAAILGFLLDRLGLAQTTHPHVTYLHVSFETKIITAETQEYNKDETVAGKDLLLWEIQPAEEIMRQAEELRRFDDPREKGLILEDLKQAQIVLGSVTSLEILFVEKRVTLFTGRAKQNFTFKDFPEEYIPISYGLTKYTLESVLWWRAGRGTKIESPVQRVEVPYVVARR